MIETIVNTTDTITKTLPPSVSLNLNTIIIFIVSGLATIITFFLKRTLNITTQEIKELKESKMSVSSCVLKEEITKTLFNNIHDNIQEIKEGQKEMKESVDDLTETLTNIRIFLNKNRNTWDGVTERRANSRGAIN